MAGRFHKRIINGLLVLCVMGVAGLVVGSSAVSAAQLTGRGLFIQDTQPGHATNHEFSFSYTSVDAVGSIVFEYCTNPFIELSCTAPDGINASGAVLSGQSGETGYFILSAQTNRITLTRAPAVPPSQNPSRYTFSNIINPSGDPTAFYVRITTYASTNGSGPYTDFGAVVNTTTTSVQVSTEVPPILKFCVGLVLADDCTTDGQNVIDLGNLTTQRPATGTSQMIAATNAEFGLAISIYGTTMTSGNNVITPLASPTVSAPGNAQFGINLRQNTDPPIGTQPIGSGISTPTGPYNIPNRFTFNNGDVVATSSSATDSRKFTASYIVNISPDQPPGVYTATLTYVCAATF